MLVTWSAHFNKVNIFFRFLILLSKEKSGKKKLRQKIFYEKNFGSKGRRKKIWNNNDNNKFVSGFESRIWYYLIMEHVDHLLKQINNKKQQFFPFFSLSHSHMFQARSVFGRRHIEYFSVT